MFKTYLSSLHFIIYFIFSIEYIIKTKYIMSSLYQTFFGPLDKNSCLYFFILSSFFLIVLIFVLIKEVIYVFKHYKSLDYMMFWKGLLITTNIFLAYFVNRLMYTMCTKSLM